MVSLDGPEQDRFAAHLLLREQKSQAGVTRAVGISASTLNPLFGPEPYRLRDREDAERLLMAAWKLVKMVWTPSEQKYRESVLSDLDAATPSSKAKETTSKAIDLAIARIAHQHLFSAVHDWAPAALDPTRPLGERLNRGLLCCRTIYDWKWKIPHDSDVNIRASVSDAEALQCAEQVAAALLKLAAEDPRTWFNGPFDKAQQTGARITRLLIETAATGLFLKNSKTSQLDKVNHMTRVASSGFLADSVWADNLVPGEIARLYNAWVVAMMANRWHSAACLGRLLLKKHGRILENSVSSLTAIIDDEEVWPGLAAMLVVLPRTTQKRISELGVQRETSKLLRRLEKLDPRLFRKESYIQIHHIISTL
jgi:hypothetical protein